MIEITNHGGLITTTNYWESEYAQHGKLIISPNAGVIRCLIPPALYGALGDLRASEYAVVSRGELQGRVDGLEIMWEDHTDTPYAWHITSDSCLMMPGSPGADHWTIACWIERRGEPHKAIERPCHWRKVDKLPCMKPWKT